jgi:hypothetical protein
LVFGVETSRIFRRWKLAELREQDRIAFALDVARIAVHLVEEQIAGRHRAQAHGAVGAEARCESTRYWSAHAETVSSGSGLRPSRQARSIAFAPS